MDTSLRGTVVPLPACGERSDRAAIRVRGPLRESERRILTLRIVERPPHPDPLPARGEREHIRRANVSNVDMNILSIQSHVAYGHVGNSAAVFALQRLGCEVWPVHTVQFSNHLGYGAFRGSVFDAAHIGEVVRGIAERGALARCDGVLSGYLGAAHVG